MAFIFVYGTVSGTFFLFANLGYRRWNHVLIEISFFLTGCCLCLSLIDRADKQDRRFLKLMTWLCAAVFLFSLIFLMDRPGPMADAAAL